MGDVVNFSIMALAGIWMTCVGFRVIPPPGRGGLQAKDEWLRRWGRVFKVMGPVAILSGSLHGKPRCVRCVNVQPPER